MDCHIRHHSKTKSDRDTGLPSCHFLVVATLRLFSGFLQPCRTFFSRISLIINTFHSNWEIFLRGLISKSDAFDKIRNESITDTTMIEIQPNLFINIVAEKTVSTITTEVSDIWMTKNELVNNLKTNVKSGTKVLMETSGQFGLGFV